MERPLPYKNAPFRGIKPYRFIDQMVFNGRDHEIESFLKMVIIYRTNLFIGGSGVGKSSLINAGLIPRLMKKGYEVDVFRVQPIEGEEFVVNGITKAFRKEGEENTKEQLTSMFNPKGEARLVYSLSQFQQIIDSRFSSEVPEDESRKLVLVFDQFEEIVTLFEQRRRDNEYLIALQQEIVALLSELILDRSLPVKLVLVFREEFFARVKKLFARVPGVEDQMIKLEELDDIKLKNIVRGPFDHPELQDYWDAAKKDEFLKVSDSIITQVRQNNADGVINFHELQIICSKLWESDNPKQLLAKDRIQGITSKFLTDSLNKIKPAHQEVSKSILGMLVTDKYRDFKSLETIKKELERRRYDDIARNKEELRGILDELEDKGLIRSEERGAATIYEVVSEFLVDGINNLKQTEQLNEKDEEINSKTRLLQIAAAFALLLIVAVIIALSESKRATKARDEANEINRKLSITLAERDSALRETEEREEELASKQDSLILAKTIADSLRIQSDSTNVQLTSVLSERDIALRETEEREKQLASNQDSLIKAKALADSLRIGSDSLRREAEDAQVEAERLRLNSIALQIANPNFLQSEQKDINAFLALLAWALNKGSPVIKEEDDPIIFEALRSTYHDLIGRDNVSSFSLLPNDNILVFAINPGNGDELGQQEYTFTTRLGEVHSNNKIGKLGRSDILLSFIYNDASEVATTFIDGKSVVRRKKDKKKGLKFRRNKISKEFKKSSIEYAVEDSLRSYFLVDGEAFYLENGASRKSRKKSINSDAIDIIGLDYENELYAFSNAKSTLYYQFDPTVKRFEKSLELPKVQVQDLEFYEMDGEKRLLLNVISSDGDAYELRSVSLDSGKQRSVRIANQYIKKMTYYKSTDTTDMNLAVIVILGADNLIRIYAPQQMTSGNFEIPIVLIKDHGVEVKDFQIDQGIISALCSDNTIRSWYLTSDLYARDIRRQLEGMKRFEDFNKGVIALLAGSYDLKRILSLKNPDAKDYKVIDNCNPLKYDYCSYDD